MRCILVFDHLNDILFSKCDKKFVHHIQKLSRTQGFDQNEEWDEEGEFDVNYVIQLFSPIVTSQRVMSSQFGNSYTSIQCQDGINMVFDEYMGYLFVHMGYEEVNILKRMLGICIAIIQHLCGPDVSVLKRNKSKVNAVQVLLDKWIALVDKDQSVLVEALEQLTVNSELSTAALAALRDATDSIKSLLDMPKSHALIFVENKFLALYSSRSARELSAGDILFLSLLAESCKGEQKILFEEDEAPGDSSLSSEEFYSPESSPQLLRKSQPSVNGSSKGALYSELVLLSGDNGTMAVNPHVVHISTLTEGVSLLLLYQTQSEAVSIGLNEAFVGATMIAGGGSGMNGQGMVAESEGPKRGMEILETGMKHFQEGIKKIRDSNPRLEPITRAIYAKHELLKKLWKEGGESGVSGCTSGLIQQLKDALNATVLDFTVVGRALPAALSISHTVASTLLPFTDFLKVKALRNFTLGSRASLSINKYLEEFPGLVHFLYIDRNNHRVTAPSLDFKSQQTVALTKKKIWAMVEFSRSHLQEGHLAIMWKDTTFNYAYYLWFEDSSGAPLKPKISPSIAVKSLPIPGVIGGDFYQRLIEACFPKTGSGKVRCYELFCIHLGLATSSCVLEHSRRLAATIWEVTGLPNNPLDLL